MERIDRNAVHPNANVSSTDFFHKFAAPTLPPVKCNTVYNCEAAFSNGALVGAGAVPLRNRKERADRAACDARCRVG